MKTMGDAARKVTRPRSHDEMFRAALRRPKNYFDLSAEQQWAIDKELGILDWEGPRTREEMALMSQRHDVIVKK